MDASDRSQFHSRQNLEKMANNQPLNDIDRWDWLITLREAAIKQLETADSVLVTCSALKNKYRDVIRIAAYNNPNREVHFIYLRVGEDTLQSRVAARTDHYMKDTMVHSQMVALEEPIGETDVLFVDVNRSKEEVRKDALAAVTALLVEYTAKTAGN